MSAATLATLYVTDIDRIVEDLAQSGVELIRYEEFEHDAKGITARTDGRRIAWCQDPDGNTFALEADVRVRRDSASDPPPVGTDEP